MVNSFVKMILLKLLLISLSLVCFQSIAFSQTTKNYIPEYLFEDGQIVIRIDKDLISQIQDSVFTKFGINALEPINALLQGDYSTFTQNGWTVKDRGKKGIEFRRNLEPVADFSNPNSHMLLATMFTSDNHPGIPIMQGKIGVNDLKGEYPKTVINGLTTFRLEGYQTADEVLLSGSFNQWSTTKLKLERRGDAWEVQVELKPGKHLYKFIIDGKWISDKSNNLSEDDGYNGNNSVYYVTNHMFSFTGDLDLKRVYLSGSFVDWNPKKLQMIKVQDGSFKLPVYLVEGTYTYKFVADGDWLTDSSNSQKVPDGNGDFNSVLAIGKPLLFRLDHFPEARNVFVCGDFNGWNQTELALSKVGREWQLPYVLSPGNYQYKFIVDEQWVLDPANDISIEDGAGNKNSFLVVKPNYTFKLNDFLNAKEVILTGSFCGWNEHAFKMKKVDDSWTCELHLDPGKYTYKFIVDGKWIKDPANELWEENEFGNGNSLLWIEN
jgi:hypothetical protein